MNLENVEVGDTVYELVFYRPGFGGALQFFLPRTVARVTKTQVIIQSVGREKRFRKDTGLEVGNSGRLFAEGDEHWGKKVEDETKKYEDVTRRVKMATRIRQWTDDIVPKWDHPRLEAIHNLIGQAAYLNEKEEENRDG
jgi:hypothetical protein